MVGDGSLGAPDGAPWDGIVVAAAAPAIPDALREQLADGGRLVIPVGPRDRQMLTVVTRHGDEWVERAGRRRASSSRWSARAATPVSSARQRRDRPAGLGILGPP